jgi:hypothetical protein
MTYKFEMFIVENQNIITRKHVNNVFFFELWKHVNYNFVITFIVDNLISQNTQFVTQNFVAQFVVHELIRSQFSINKTILNIWHARLKHLRKQNVRRLTKMSKNMNLMKFVMNKEFCEFCIVIKQKFESYKSLVIFDKHSLNLMWSDLVESFVSNDKIKYFVTFLCDFIKRSMIYVLRVKSSTFEAFRHFQLHNEYKDNRVRRLRTNWEEEYSSNEFDYSRLQKACRFSVLGIPHFFLTAFWPHQSSKSDLLLLLIVTLNDLYIDDLNDKFSFYICNSSSKTLYSARFFNDLIQTVWFSSSSRLFDSSFWSSSRLAFSDDRFWNLSYRWKIFLHVNKCLRNWHSSDDRMTDFDQVFVHHFLIFIKFTIFKSDFHQIHHSNFRCSFLKFRIQTENFSCMSISSYESDTAAWS